MRELIKLEDIIYSLIDNHVEKLKKYLKMNLPYENNKCIIVNKLLNNVNDVYDVDNLNKFKNYDKISEIIYYLYNNREIVIRNYEKYLKEKNKI